MATRGGWRLERASGLTWARCSALDAVPGIAHGFSTRRSPDGVDSDMGPAEAPSPAVLARRAAFARAVGLGARKLALPRQAHGRLVVTSGDLAEGPVEADGVILVRPAGEDAGAPAVRTADCVPILAASASGGAMAAIHAGWRGIARGVVFEAIEKLAARGVGAAGLVVALGPAIGPCCYEVGEEVVEALERACGARERFVPSAGPRLRVDLHAALRAQLVGAGVASGAIHTAPWCTRCRNDLFFSVRAEGPAAGRLVSAIGPAASAP